jgi:methanogenic corrinoid protein MtbC1
VRREDALRVAAAVSGAPRGERRPPKRLAADLVAGRRQAVLAWTRDWVEAGGSVSEMVRRSLAPAMREVGSRWAAGALDVGAEHRATALASEALVIARGMAPHRAVARRTLLLGCPPGELHALPALMAAQRFLDSGWEVDFLGADVPEADFVRQAERTAPDAVGISSTMDAESASSLVAALERSRWSGPIVVGGARSGEVAARHPGAVVADGDDVPPRLAALRGHA